MGCSASKSIGQLAKNPEHRSSATSTPHSSKSSPPVHRAFSMPTPLVHHLPLRKGDTHHLVSLTSTTYGSLLLIDRPKPKTPTVNVRDLHSQSEIANLTDSEPSLSPDSVINTWELMDGLDDFDFDRGEDLAKASTAVYDCKIEFSDKHNLKSSDIVEEKSISSISPLKPLWQHLSEESLLSKLDPNVGLSYRRALSSRQLGSANHCKSTRSVGSSPLSCSFSNNWFHLPGTEDRIVIYFTSLRGIRKTHEDCCLVRMIFRGFRVPVDERDISMDSSYRKELQTAVRGKMLSLPQVFIRGKYIGGAEEIKLLNEAGEMGKLLEGFPVGDARFACKRCGEVRFIPCLNCNGSRKMFDEEEGELKRCHVCNENGLIRCPDCCS